MLAEELARRLEDHARTMVAWEKRLAEVAASMTRIRNDLVWDAEQIRRATAERAEQEAAKPS